jgi:uncharacterized protein DUF885
MWEAGLGNADPSVHVGQLLNALLRNVRLLSAIGLHTGGMSVAESETMFREKAFQDPGNARQQADRGTFDPAYGAYTLEPISNSLQEHCDAGKLDEPEEVFRVVLPANQDSTLPLQPCEIALNQPSSLVAT